MLNRGLDKLELLRIVESVANEKSIDKELVIGSMESAIQKAALTKFGNDNNIEVVNIQNVNGQTALTTSIRNQKPGLIQIVELLLKNEADVNLTIGGYDGYTALMDASKRGYSKIVGMLLDHGADIHIKNNHKSKTKRTNNHMLD